MERQALRALVGSPQYAAVNSCLCSRLGCLQSRINSAEVSTLIEANKTLPETEAKLHATVSSKVQPIDINRGTFIGFSDASLASNKEPVSHQGMVIMACDEKIQHSQSSVVNPIA